MRALRPVSRVASLALCGVVLGGAQPILIGYGQRMLPDGQRLASSITMGATWGISGAAVAAVLALANAAGQPGMAFYVFAASTLASCAVAWVLPDLT